METIANTVNDIDELIAGYLSMELTREEAAVVENWVSESEENASHFRQARDLWFSIQDPDAAVKYDSSRAFARFQQMVSREKHRKLLSRKIFHICATAAALAVVATFPFSWSKHRQELAYTDIVVEAPTGAQSHVTLPDGSSVWLNTGSKIVYKSAFGRKSREIKLTGEGMFDVVKDTKHPFLVHTDNVTVKVLGTTFCVSDYNGDESVFVALVEGKVELSSADESQKVYLRPDDFMSMDLKDGRMEVKHSRELVEASTRWTEGQILMEEKYLSEIAGIIQKYYGVQVRISDMSLYEQRYRAIFYLEEQSLDEVLGALAKASGNILKYKIQDNTVTLYR